MRPPPERMRRTIPTSISTTDDKSIEAGLDTKMCKMIARSLIAGALAGFSISGSALAFVIDGNLADCVH